MSLRYTNQSDHAVDVLIFALDPAVVINVPVGPTYTISGVAHGQGASMAYPNPHDYWIGLSDGAGGYTNLTLFNTGGGMNVRQVGNATDGYTFLQS